MAAPQNMTDIEIQKNSKIVVNVDESLPDILVVTYEYGSKIYKGVLLDSTKRNLPCGITSLNPAFNEKPDGDDKLYSVNQRFAYLEPSSNDDNIKQTSSKRQVRLPARYKNAKMTVRLRPRQVLCSKCRGICNENSENVDNSRKRKTEVEETKNNTQPPQPKRVLNGVSTRLSKPLSSTDSQNNERPRPYLSLRLARPVQEKLARIQGEKSENSQSSEESSSKASDNNKQLTEVTKCSEDITISKSSSSKAKNMVLRKKQASVGSMEDLWDENVLEETNLNDELLGTNTRTIKISFGPEGEGTVLKIPAKIPDNFKEPSDKDDKVRSKAARRALKKARKEARRKILLGSGGSPCYMGSSPRYPNSNGSPRLIGGASPRYAFTSPTSGFENMVPKRHKHKVKHKKKHKEDRQKRESTPEKGESSQEKMELTPPPIEENLTDPLASPPPENYLKEIKERCLKQKLSINLKRLNTGSYTQCEYSPESSDEHGESAPDFPPPSQPLMMRITAQAVASGLGADGRRLGIGDVVWGKIHGFPWWPGKVLSITKSDDSPDAPQQAHVAWYGSSTSSLMPCDQLSPFLENFKIRYNKKKRGPYKEAIKQATCEARTESSASPLSVPPALASPPQIDVVS